MRRHKEIGGNVSAIAMSRGKPEAVVSRRLSTTPASELARGKAEAVRTRMAGGGGHNELFLKAKKRDEILGQTPEMKRGGKAKCNSLVGMFKSLHGKFEKEPQMRALGATKSSVYEGEPHRETKSEMRRAEGGKLAAGGHYWMQGAVKKPGALHKALGIPMGKKIPLSKIKKAEHSKSPLMRHRAHFAEVAKQVATRRKHGRA